MKILYVGNFAVPWSTETYVTHALRQLGCDVTCVSASTRRVSVKGHDVLLLSKRTHRSCAKTIETARKMGLTTACWFWDLLWGYRPETPRMPQMKCDIVFSTDGGHDEAWTSHSIRHEVLRQGIHAPERVMKSRGSRFLWDVAFVGGTRTDPPYRRALVAWLKERYGKRFLWVQGVRGLELNKILARTKVVVGDSYPVPRYWSNRVYEITGRGGFLLHPRIEGLDEEFPENIVPRFDRRRWRDELPVLVDRYLEDDKVREAARLTGFEQCGRYTYERRCECLISTLREALSSHTNYRSLSD